MMQTLSGRAIPWRTAQSTASRRSSCILPAHSLTAALRNAFPSPVEPRKFTARTA